MPQITKTYTFYTELTGTQANEVPTVMAGDSGVRLLVYITNSSQPVDLTGITRVHAAFARPGDASPYVLDLDTGVSIRDAEGGVIAIDGGAELFGTTEGIVQLDIMLYAAPADETPQISITGRMQIRVRRPIEDNSSLLENTGAPVLIALQEELDEALEAQEAQLSDTRRALTDVDDFLTTANSAESGRTSAEAARTASETLRGSAETLRASAESSRGTAETARADAETLRASAESSRGTAETARADAETLRASAESSRITAETLRGSAESSRANAESSRVSAETSRWTAESGRVTAETERASAESSRGTAETGRIDAEASRVSAESSRVTAETARAALWDNVTATAESVQAGGSPTATLDRENKTLEFGIPVGMAATVTVGTVTTGEPGTSASVSNSGTDTAAVLNFVIPKGAAGNAPFDTNLPLMDGAASAGVSGAVARIDHVHPSDTSKQTRITASGLLKCDGDGGVSAAVAGTDYAAPGAIPSASAAEPAMDGMAAAGMGSAWAREDHVHPTDTSRYQKPVIATEQAVAASAWAADTTYPNYGYRASVAITDAVASMLPEVIFAPDDAAGGKLASVAEAYDGGVYIYAKSALDASITIPTIICWRTV